MKRIATVLVATALMVVMLVASAMPAFADGRSFVNFNQTFQTVQTDPGGNGSPQFQVTSHTTLHCHNTC